ncbi:hypothetical protein BT96DRAFT_997600 [Gymnopus androsaceus JB14]|uniref:KOW domain-containing protein n=1 Tax=Gymnopus androsaceus JB14 TaxID=1447944 RepID=A0A6A4HB38_9AGAR|nr:hypothetical protein BT96DRAFT_997600 [Gymnopus androsaceus JB14]
MGFQYQNWNFSGGLILKLFSKQTLVATQEIPSEMASLFQTVQGQHDGLVNLATMPLPTFWDFQEGEKVLIIASNSERKAGTVETALQWQRAAIGLVQEISLGDFVKVVAGQHQGKSSFVAAKNDGHLGICKGTKERGSDFLVHTNSTRLATPMFQHIDKPWVSTEVILVSGSLSGTSATVQDIAIDAQWRLRLTVQLISTGRIVELGYTDMQECWTKCNLMDFLPLKPSQQEFNIEFPWWDVQVRIVVGTFAVIRQIFGKTSRMRFLTSLPLEMV